VNLWNKLLGKREKSRDPLSCEDALGTGEASEKRLDAFFSRLEAVSLNLAVIDGCGRLSKDQGIAESVRGQSRELLQKAEASLRDSYLSHPAVLQAGLLMSHYRGDEGCLSARRYLLKWFNGCDVEGAHAVLETYVGAAKACAVEKQIQTVVDKCADNLLRWRSKGFKI
jgi:hypothetical protein